MIQTLFVAVDEKPVAKTFNGIDDLINYFESESITTFDTGIPGVGMVAGDQDDPDLPENVLGINGDFLLVGMDQTGPMSKIRSLENHEIFGLKIGLAQSIEKGIKVQ